MEMDAIFDARWKDAPMGESTSDKVVMIIILKMGTGATVAAKCNNVAMGC